MKGNKDLFKVKLINEIKKNLLGYDLILCFFFAALNSYRKDRCLRPFPSTFTNETGKNFTSLKNVCDSIPALSQILSNPESCSEEALQLLTWLFLEKRQFVLKKINSDAIKKISDVYKPQFVFELIYNEKIEEAWLKRKGQKDVILAYHGSGIDNFYSILNVGLQQYFSIEKEVLFGNGIYLSNEVSVSAHYAPFGHTWKHSQLGTKHSSIAVCEIINDIAKVKCRDSQNKERSVNQNGLGEIPEKYFVVTDSEMVRVKYLLIYREKKLSTVKSVIRKNLSLLLIIVYILIIALIGFYNNMSYKKILRGFNRFINS